MKWVKWLLVMVLILWVVVGWLGVRVYVPVNPVKPYFLVSMSRVSGLGWPLGRSQPVTLGYAARTIYCLPVTIQRQLVSSCLPKYGKRLPPPLMGTRK